MPVDFSATQVMGILNVTPDSFSDGGRFIQVDQAVSQALAMQAQGAAMIDIGGESTRPGAEPVSVADELARVIPVIKAIRERSDIMLSIDTSKPEVMQAAVAAGANMINDVLALQADGALAVVAELAVPVCLMHMQGQPRSMQQQPQYTDVCAEVTDFLQARREVCLQAGIKNEHILFDPGFGFGKTLQHNLKLFKYLPELCALGVPVLIGVSKKSMIGAIADINDPQQRLPGSLALAALASWFGVSIIRAHDVAATRQALQVSRAVMTAEN